MKPYPGHLAAFVCGIVATIGLTLLLVGLYMGPASADMRFLGISLGITGAVVLGLGLLLHHWGWWHGFRRLSFILTLSYLASAAITLLVVGINARLMFVSAHDLILASILLVFAAGISVSFGFYLSGSIAKTLCDVSLSAAKLSEGDFSIRVDVVGRNEVAELAASFNMMAARLERAAEEQGALDLARRNLVAWASHDLRTPLASLRAMIDALADGVASDEETVARYHRQSKSEIARMSALIDDLFDLARLDAGDMTVHGEPVSLSDLISDVLAAFSAAASARQISLKGTVDPSIDSIWMAPDQISRVLNNLMSNALRHTGPGGEICLDARRIGDDEVEVRVQDTGEGIAPADLPFVFDRFYRGEKSRSHEGYASGGAGLGLAIVRGIIDAHGGMIRVESEHGNGTQFVFTLPVMPSDSVSAKQLLNDHR